MEDSEMTWSGSSSHEAEPLECEPVKEVLRELLEIPGFRTLAERGDFGRGGRHPPSPSGRVSESSVRSGCSSRGGGETSTTGSGSGPGEAKVQPPGCGRAQPPRMQQGPTSWMRPQGSVQVRYWG